MMSIVLIQNKKDPLGRIEIFLKITGKLFAMTPEHKKIKYDYIKIFHVNAVLKK